MRRIYYAIAFIIILAVAASLDFVFSGRGPGRKDSSPVSAQSAGTATAVSSEESSPSGPSAGAQSEDSIVEVPPDRYQVIGLKTAAAAVKPMKKTLRTVGRVEVDERKLTTVNIKVDGWIEKLYADYTGKYVSKGSPLAKIYSPELMSLQLEYINLINWKTNLGLRTQRNIEFSLGDRYGTVGRLTVQDLDPLFEVIRQKLSLWEIPEQQIKQIEKTKAPIRTFILKSPVNGYVVQKPVLKGTRVAPGDKIVDIADLSTVWVLADIYEYEIPHVKIGQNARITLSYYPQKEYSARVDFVYPSLSGQTRTSKVRFVLPNPTLLLKPQMFANVEMEIDLGERLSIPETAVLDTGTRQVVYVDLGDGSFAARRIKTGDRANGAVEVLSGLKAGEKVASSAVFLIDSEAKLRGVSQ